MKPDWDTASWDNSLALGIPVIDDQHRHLLRSINKLSALFQENAEIANHFFAESLYEAAEYLQFHFNTEEKIMILMKYDGLIDHKNEHECLMRILLAETASISNNRCLISCDFSSFLKDQALSHITIHDKMMAEYIKNAKEYGKFRLILMRNREEAHQRA